MAPPSSSKTKRGNFKPRSLVWDFFGNSSEGNSIVQCPKCEANIKYCGSTSGLKYHLQTQHPEDYEKLSQKKSQCQITAPNTVKEAELQLAKAFATGLVPFRFIENVEFRQFLDLKPQSFIAPSADRMKRIVQQIAEDHILRSSKEFNGLERFTLLTDGFTDSRQKFHVYSVHISFVDDKFTRKIRFCSLQTVKRGDSTSISQVVCTVLILLIRKREIASNRKR
uniref:BED-type domain-containing protein n=1 Tax=Caenorhabditis japonica TaxID=281687 RepID=A0A8R1E7J9_CAEJA